MITRKWLFLGLVLLLIFSLLVGCARLLPVQPPPPLPPEIDEFPETLAEVAILTPAGQQSIIELTGPTTAEVNFEGAAEGEARDNDGDGLDEVSTEIVSMELTGIGPPGPIVVRVNPNIPSTGEIEEIINNTPGLLDVPPFTTEGTAHSYFDMYLEVRIGELIFWTIEPKRMETIIRHKPPQEGDTYQNPDLIPLVDRFGQPTGFYIGMASHTPVPPPPLPPEELIDGSLVVSGVDSFWSGPETCESFFDVQFMVQDLTGGDYPVTYAALYINEEPYYSQEIYAPTFVHNIPNIPADCGEHIDLELVAMNPVSVEPIVVATASFTTPIPPPPVAEDVLYAYVDAGYECTCNQFLECTDCDVYIDFGAEDISMLLGPYPVTNVVLYVDGVKKHDSGPISVPFYDSFYDIPEPEARCGQTYNLRVVARNSIDVEVTVLGTVTTPLFCEQQ